MHTITHTDLWNQDLRLHIEKTPSKYHETSQPAPRLTRPCDSASKTSAFEAESCQADCLESGMGRVCFEPVP